MEVFEDDNLAELQRRARAPVTGENKTVLSDMKYKDWYKENVDNNPKALAEEKKIRNKASDKKQYENTRKF